MLWALGQQAVYGSEANFSTSFGATLATTIGVPASRVGIVSVTSGSVIVDFYVQSNSQA